MLSSLFELLGKMFSRKPVGAKPDHSLWLINAEQLSRIYGGPAAAYAKYVSYLNEVLDTHQINTPKRVAAFLAQIGHESARLSQVVESLNYSAEGLAKTWPNRYANADGTPNPIAHALARNPEAIANNTYANRMGNGDALSGDGWRYRGRGLIQLTGKDNYRKMSVALGHDFLARPDDLTLPGWAVRSAAQYWSDHDLNAFADNDDIVGMTRVINGGLNGLQDRMALYDKALQVFS